MIKFFIKEIVLQLATIGRVLRDFWHHTFVYKGLSVSKYHYTCIKHSNLFQDWMSIEHFTAICPLDTRVEFGFLHVFNILSRRHAENVC